MEGLGSRSVTPEDCADALTVCGLEALPDAIALPHYTGRVEALGEAEVKCCILVCFALLVVGACESSTVQPHAIATPTTTTGVVFGGIQACSGLPPSVAADQPQYAAGTVTALRGTPIFHPGGYAELPTVVAGQETVPQNALYRFELAPGTYVLVATFPPRSDVKLLTMVTVQPGLTVEADIPNPCR